jgi:hypothetical protein
VVFAGDTGVAKSYLLAAAGPSAGDTAAWLHLPTSGTIQVRDLSPSMDTPAGGSVRPARWWDLAFALAIVCGWGLGTLVWLSLLPLLYLFSLALVERVPVRLRPMVIADLAPILRCVHIGLTSMYGLWTLASLWMLGQRLMSAVAIG